MGWLDSIDPGSVMVARDTLVGTCTFVTPAGRVWRVDVDAGTAELVTPSPYKAKRADA
jgi:hypothetical protein